MQTYRVAELRTYKHILPLFSGALVAGVTDQNSNHLLISCLSLGCRLVGSCRIAQVAYISQFECLSIFTNVKPVKLPPNDLPIVMNMI
jgi:hypothetical protein